MTAVFLEGLRRYFSADQLELLSSATIGIAGVGGLGSNCAMFLARCGIGGFVLIDHDVVDASNLNRQHYWPRQIGMAKVTALGEHLLELNSFVRLAVFEQELTAGNMQQVLGRARIWVEAFDQASAKRLFVETALGQGCQVVAASGICGFGREPLQKRRLGSLTVVGDFRTDICVAPPLAPRVAQAAAIMADCVLELVLGPPAQNPESAGK